MAKYDELSFKKAFAAARAELGKSATFTWRGTPYSTRLAEEPAKAPKKDVAPKTSIRPRAKPPTGDAMKGYRKGDITTTSLDNTRPTGRGDGSLELIRRTAENALAKSAAASKYPATDNAAILLARRIRESVSGQGGISDRGSRGPTVDSTAPRQNTTTNIPPIKNTNPNSTKSNLAPKTSIRPRPMDPEIADAESWKWIKAYNKHTHTNYPLVDPKPLTAAELKDPQKVKEYRAALTRDEAVRKETDRLFNNAKGLSLKALKKK